MQTGAQTIAVRWKNVCYRKEARRPDLIMTSPLSRFQSDDLFHDNVTKTVTKVMLTFA